MVRPGEARPRAAAVAAIAASALVCAGFCAGCGALANAGHEQKGDSNLPSAGVAPWDKVDLDGDPTNLIQPWLFESSGAGDVLDEPALVHDGSSYTLFYQRSGDSRSAGIWRTAAGTPEDLYHAGPGGRVMTASAAWEAGHVGAPSLLVGDAASGSDRLALWYEGGDAAGIGFATSADGETWSKRGAPVLVPDQDWEAGWVASPTVVRMGDELWLWYEGGGGTGIGFARSPDGITWVKEDAAGHRSGGGAHDVQPVFTPSLAWEGASVPSLAPGRVGRPNVAVDLDLHPPRLGLYYTGFVPIASNPLADAEQPDATPGSVNQSIGYAASLDGVHWTRADPGINPIVAEKTPVQLGSVPFPPQFAAQLPRVVLDVLDAVLGVGDDGNPKIPALETVIDEGAASVIPDGPNHFVMVFTQGNSLFVPLAIDLPPSSVTTPLGLLVQDTTAGIALARNRP